MRKNAFTCTEHKGEQELLSLAIEAVVEHINDQVGEEIVKRKIAEVKEVKFKNHLVEFDTKYSMKYNIQG